MRETITTPSSIAHVLERLSALVVEPSVASPCPFRERGLPRLLIYPIEATGLLTRIQFDALAKAALLVEDYDAFVIDTTRLDGPVESALPSKAVTRVTLDSYEDYAAPDPTAYYLADNAILSPTGSWAILASHEGHALMTGVATVLSSVEDDLPPETVMVSEFLEDLKVELGILPRARVSDWVRLQLEHVLGRDVADELWSRTMAST